MLREIPPIIKIVFDAPPGPEAGRFIDIEDLHGCSINIGKWYKRLDGAWELVITEQDWENLS